MADMTPAEWLELLNARLDQRWSRMMVYDAYYNGDHPMAFATAKFREAFGSLLSAMSDNWCQIIVLASQQRLKVQGFRFGATQGADSDAWRIWQTNQLDAQSDMVHTEAIKLGEAYWLVEPPLEPGALPRITAEHPREMIVATAAGDRSQRLAAFKKWTGDDGYIYATLYLPTEVLKFRSELKAKDGNGKIRWIERPGDPGGPNSLREVSAVPVCNAPGLLTGGTSDLKPGIPLQLAIDKLASDLLVASEFSAFRQRVMTGVEVPLDPLTNQPMKVEFAVNRLFTVEDPDAKVYDLQASDLANYVGAIEMFVQHLAAQTQTPPHYLLGKMVNTSGDALAVAETGLVAKVRDKMVTFGEAHEEAMRLAFLSMGDLERASAVDAETIWRDPQRQTVAQIADAAVKKKDVGVPWAMLMEELGYSPQQIARMRAMQAEQDLFGPIGEPAPTNVRVAETTNGPGGTVQQTAPTNGSQPS